MKENKDESQPSEQQDSSKFSVNYLDEFANHIQNEWLVVMKISES